MQKPLAIFAGLMILVLTSCGRPPESVATGAPTPTPDGQTLSEKANIALQTAGDKTKELARTTADKTRDVAADVRARLSDKAVEWHLTPDEIKADLANSGRVVREKSVPALQQAGVVFDRARIVAVINGKLVADPQLSALRINVEADDGVVTLRGTVKSPELISRATLLALDTEGVHQVVALLSVDPKS